MQALRGEGSRLGQAQGSAVGNTRLTHDAKNDFTMRTLILFRHAKSSWDLPELKDFDRPLNARGQDAAPRMAAYIAENDHLPDHIICSAARRARETLDLALPFWKPPPTIDYADALYHASPQRLLAVTRGAPDTASKLMIVGHNPGLEAFADKITGRGDKTLRLAMANKFPTAAIAAITFDERGWKSIVPGDGHLTLFITPKGPRD